MLDITCRLYQELRINAVDIHVTCKNTSAPCSSLDKQKAHTIEYVNEALYSINTFKKCIIK